MTEPTAIIDWRDLGAKPMKRMSDGRAAWRLRADRRSPEDWTIEAKHGGYLGKHPYNLGDDAWRISIQRYDMSRDVMVEVGHVVARSEAEAHEAVRYFATLADHPEMACAEWLAESSLSGRSTPEVSP